MKLQLNINLLRLITENKEIKDRLIRDIRNLLSMKKIIANQ